MSVAVEGPGGERQLLTKGAPEAVFARCTHFESEGETFRMEPILVGNLIEQVNDLSEDGFRVLAVATKKVDKRPAYSKADECELVLTGYLAFLEGKVIVIPGLLNKIGAQSVRISPRSMVRKVTRKLQES